MNKAIVEFYSGKKPDSEGRMIGTIRNWDNNKLEIVHNYIQWLFPLGEPSQFNPNAPILDQGQINEFHTDKNLREELLKSLDIMLCFYGFQRNQKTISRSNNWEKFSHNWLSPGNHNYLRITRILTSLSILGLKDYAIAFYNALQNVYSSGYDRVIGDITYDYWRCAVKK